MTPLVSSTFNSMAKEPAKSDKYTLDCALVAGRSYCHTEKSVFLRGAIIYSSLTENGTSSK